MGLFNFVKEAGEKLWDTVTGNASAEDQSAKLKEHLDKSGFAVHRQSRCAGGRW